MKRDRLIEILGPENDVSSDYGTAAFDITPGNIKAPALRAMLEEGLVEVGAAGDWGLQLQFAKE